MQIALGMFFTLLSLFIISASTSSGDGHTGEGVSAHLIEKKEDLGYDPIQAGAKDPNSTEKQDGTGPRNSAKARTDSDDEEDADGETLGDGKKGAHTFPVSAVTIQF